MARGNKRKNVPPTGREGRSEKRLRKSTRPFEQGVNPPAAQPHTPPPTTRRPAPAPAPTPSRQPTPPCHQDTLSPLFVPDASQLATDAQAAEIQGEYEDEEDTGEGEEVEEQPTTAATPTAVPIAAQVESNSLDEEPHLHIRWRAYWGAMEKNAIPSAARFARNKPMYAINADKLWRWADEVIQGQLPRIGQISSLTATLYYNASRLAKADRCTIALQRRRAVAGESVVLGNWGELLEQVEELNKESSQPLNCDFDLVIKEVEQALLPPLGSQSLPRGSVRLRPGVATAIQEEGLASVVTAEVFATGHAIGIRDRWRCQEESCSNNPMVCWVRRLPGRQIDRREEHYAVNGNVISAWAAAIARGDCTVDEPTDDIRLSIMMSRDRADNLRRRRRKVSPTSSNSSIEGLTKAILAGHLAQMRATGPQRCYHSHQSAEDLNKRRRWTDLVCSRVELIQHTYNFFRYWSRAMPQFDRDIKDIKELIFEKGHYDINMLMDPEDGMTLETWVYYFDKQPALLAHLRRKAHDWIGDYGGLTKANFDAMNRGYRNATNAVAEQDIGSAEEQEEQQEESEPAERARQVSAEVSSNVLSI